MAPRRHFSHLFSHRSEAPHAPPAAPAPTTTRPGAIAIQAPIPLDSTKASVAQLSDLVVRRILAYLHELSPQDVQIVATLNSFLYEQARYVQHSHVHINLDRNKHVLDRLHIISQLGQFPAIRTLRVSSSKCNQLQLQQASDEILAYLAEILPAMTGLRQLEWHVDLPPPELASISHRSQTTVPIPAPILARLPANSRLQTSVSCNPTQESHALARTCLERLAENRSLRSLSISVCSIREQDCLETMRALKKVLLTCPNLTRIPEFDVFYPRGGCEDYGPSSRGSPYCGLGFLDGEKPLGALEELGMRDYPWGIEGSPQYQGYNGHGFRYEWQYWAETFDWSKLVQLNGLLCHLGAIAPKLTNVKKIRFENQYGPEDDFLENIPVTSPVEVISLLNWDRIGGKPETITKFGDTLRQLRIHALEDEWPYHERGMTIVPRLAHLSKGLPYLEHLTIDIDRNTNDWPYEALDIIATFPSLRTVELWFPLGNDPPAPTPVLTANSARHLFLYLRKRNKDIYRLTVRSGAPRERGPPPNGFSIPPITAPVWREQNSIGFVCEINYIGEAHEGVSVSCTNLSNKKNAELDRLSQQADRQPIDPVKLDAQSLRFRVALDGPISKSEWESRENEARLRLTKVQQERAEQKKQDTRRARWIPGPLKRVWKE